jgi:hypothetical protein
LSRYSSGVEQEDDGGWWREEEEGGGREKGMLPTNLSVFFCDGRRQPHLDCHVLRESLRFGGVPALLLPAALSAVLRSGEL